MKIYDLIKESIKANVNGVIMADYIGYGMNSVSFLADLPKSAVVDHIKVNGKFLEDINTKKIRYHITPSEYIANKDEVWRVVATVWFEEDDLDLYFELSNYVIQDFEVFYHLEYAHECREISEE